MTLSGAANRTAATRKQAAWRGWSGCASLRGLLCAGEALLEARTQASVAFFKLGPHSATAYAPTRIWRAMCCAKGAGRGRARRASRVLL